MIHNRYKDCDVITDICDKHIIAKYTWRVGDNGSGNRYVRAFKTINGKSVIIYFHRLILGVSDNRVHVDHINGNSLDNRRCNLRLCSNAENRRNCKISKKSRLKVKGVSYKTGRNLKKPYQAKITHDNKFYHIGYFMTLDEAAEAYNKKAIQLHGEFARVNKDTIKKRRRRT